MSGLQTSEEEESSETFLHQKWRLPLCLSVMGHKVVNSEDILRFIEFGLPSTEAVVVLPQPLLEAAPLPQAPVCHKSVRQDPGLAPGPVQAVHHEALVPVVSPQSPGLTRGGAVLAPRAQGAGEDVLSQSG